MGKAPELGNLFVASGYPYGIAAGGGAGAIMAAWILDSRPSLDLWPLDVRRFSFLNGTRAFMYPRAVEHSAHHYKMRYPGQESAVARGLRRSPPNETLNARGAVYGSTNGWERPNWFTPVGVQPGDRPGVPAQNWKHSDTQD